MSCAVRAGSILLAFGAPWLAPGLRHAPAAWRASIPDETFCSPESPPDAQCVIPPVYREPGAEVNLRLDVQGSPRSQLNVSEKCNHKYLDSGLNHMAKLFREHRPKGRVFIAINLHMNAGILGNLANVLGAFVVRLGPENAFISIVESFSTDGTGRGILLLQRALRGFGARVAVKTSANGANKLVRDKYAKGDANSTSNRIDFLAKMRNAALDPLYAMHEDGEDFDKVLILNDVLPCEGDLWRLVALQADMACAFDFSKNMFYDVWVYDGQKPVGCIPQLDKHYPYRCRHTPVQVKSCWGGLTAITARAFYAGIRFRMGIWSNNNDCRESECALVSRDMWRLGFRTILADPMVQVAYEHETAYRFVRNMSEDALFDNRKRYIPDSSLTGDVHERWCCPLPNVPGAWAADGSFCEPRDFHASAAAPYPPEWLKKFEVPWYAQYSANGSHS